MIGRSSPHSDFVCLLALTLSLRLRAACPSRDTVGDDEKFIVEDANDNGKIALKGPKSNQ